MLTRKQKIFTLFAFVVFIYPIICQYQDRMIYILIWTVSEGEGWIYRDLEKEEGQEAFIRRKCLFQNCYLTVNRTYFSTVLDFDVLVFSAVHLSRNYRKKDLPFERSERQLYVFFSIEPAAYNMVMSSSFDEIFNVTWTYMLKSDIFGPYFLVKNKFGALIAPKKHVNWTNIKDMEPINNTMAQRLQFKSIAAMWVASNCAAKGRMVFVKSLNDELSKYGHRVDIYGRCGDQTECQRNPNDRNGLLTSCFNRIESDYYFYLAFENSLTEDYVSEKILHALLHFSVPIVYGGADYARFMPNGIYLNAYKLGVKGLAIEMNDIINNPQRYYDFFKWHNYYRFYDTAADGYRDSICAFCSFLNHQAQGYKRTIYNNMLQWWNVPIPDEFPNSARPTHSYPHTTLSLTNEAAHIENLSIENEKNTNSVFSNIIDYFLNDD